MQHFKLINPRKLFITLDEEVKSILMEVFNLLIYQEKLTGQTVFKSKKTSLNGTIFPY